MPKKETRSMPPCTLCKLCAFWLASPEICLFQLRYIQLGLLEPPEMIARVWRPFPLAIPESTNKSSFNLRLRQFRLESCRPLITCCGHQTAASSVLKVVCLLTVNGSPISHRHVPSDWRRATSIAYTDICRGEETLHIVCISAMSPD